MSQSGQIPKIWELYPDVVRAVKGLREQAGHDAPGHDPDHDLEVGQLGMIVAWSEDQHAAVIAGVAGLLHSTDRILDIILGLKQETISSVPEDAVSDYVRDILVRAELTESDIERVVYAVVHHGSKPNQPSDDLVTIAVADGDRLANMGASLPIRAGQHYGKLRVLNPETFEVDPSDRTPRDKYNNPDSMLWEIQNCIDWYRNQYGPYALRLPRSLEIGKIRAERLERVIREIKEDRQFVGLHPNYPF